MCQSGAFCFLSFDIQDCGLIISPCWETAFGFSPERLSIYPRFCLQVSPPWSSGQFYFAGFDSLLWTWATSTCGPSRLGFSQGSFLSSELRIGTFVAQTFSCHHHEGLASFEPFRPLLRFVVLISYSYNCWSLWLKLSRRGMPFLAPF